MYMVLGGILALTLVFGAFATFAQTDGDDDTAVPEAQINDEGDTAVPMPFDRPQFGDGPRAAPNWGGRGRGGFVPPRPDDGVDEKALLAEALGISVEDLDAAHEAARAAAIEDAVAEGLLTQEQADQLLSEAFGAPGRFGGGFMAADRDSYLAEALGISVEELQAARAEVQATKLAALVEAGVLTQEQADLMAARQAVQSYIDQEALAEIVQNAYEDAVAQALADGAITQAQADQLLENVPGLGRFGAGPGVHGGRGFGGGRGFRGGPGRMAPWGGRPPADGQPQPNPAFNG